MKIAATIFFATLLVPSRYAFSQVITGEDKSDVVVQHRLITKNQLFLFTNGNTKKRNAIAAFDGRTTTGNYPSFAMEYPARKQEMVFFRLRHPLAIQPYTKYELHFSYRSSALQGVGPCLEIAVYDETRETLVESHKISIRENKNNWSTIQFPFTTRHKARFARLIIKSNQNGSGKVWVAEVSLRQVSEPLAFKPREKVVWEKQNWQVGSAKKITAPVIRLPEGKSYYSITLQMKWREWAGSFPVYLEWLADEQGKQVIATDKLYIDNIEGIKPQWNGVACQWKRENGSTLDALSRQKDKLFNDDAHGGEGQLTIKMDKPQQAAFLRIRTAAPVIKQGVLKILHAAVKAEY